METELSVGRVRVFISVDDDEAKVDSLELMRLVTEFHAKVTERVIERRARKIGFGNGN